MISKFLDISIIGKTGIIKLNRPKALNALNFDMACDFLKALSEWKKNSKIDRVLLYSDGKSFCAGGDIKSLFLSLPNIFIIKFNHLINVSASFN